MRKTYDLGEDSFEASSAAVMERLQDLIPNDGARLFILENLKGGEQITKLGRGQHG
jgi:hypothetical protein